MPSGRNIFLLLVGIFLVFCTANAPVPLYMLWQQQMHYSSADITLIFFCYNIGVISALLVLARVRQLAIVRRVLVAALGLAFLSCVLFFSPFGVFALCLGRLFIGLACGAFASCGVATVLKLAERFDYHRAPLWITIATVLGFGCGPFFSGVLADIFPQQFAVIFLVLMCGILLCAIALVCSSLVRLLPAHQHTAGADVSEQHKPKRYGLAAIITGLFAGPFAMAALFISLGPSMVAELMHNHSRTLAGFIPLLLFGCGALCQLWLKNLNNTLLVMISQGLTFIGGVLIVVAETFASVAIMIGAAILVGMGQSLAQLSALTAMKNTCPAGSLERSTSFFFLGGYLVAGSLVMVMGAVADHLGLMAGSQVFLYLCFMIILASTFGYIFAHSADHESV